MAARENCYWLEGAVQVDYAYFSGEHPGDKLGRASENKVPFVAIVSLDQENGQQILELSMASGFTSGAIAEWAKACLAPVRADLCGSPGCFGAVNTTGCTTHHSVVVGDLKPRDSRQFL